MAINALISFSQEYNARKSMDALKDMAAPDAFVRRKGEWVSTPARGLVAGEVLRLNTGDIVADDMPLGDRVNLDYMSTMVTAGIGGVVETGMGTEVGKIADLMATAEEPRTPLQRRIDKLSQVLIGAALAVVAGIIAIGIHHGMDMIEMLNTGISLSVPWHSATARGFAL